MKVFTMPPVLKRYEYAKVFLEEYVNEFKPGDMMGPVVVGGTTIFYPKMRWQYSQEDQSLPSGESCHVKGS